MAKKFLDANGVQYLWSKINMQDYPNNETLINVINAIDETKADKNELIQNYNGELTSEEIFQAQWNLRLPNTIRYIYLGDCQQDSNWVHGYYCNYFSGIENFMTIPSPTFSSHPNVLTSFLADCYNLSGDMSDWNYPLILPRILKSFSILKENGLSSFSSFSVYKIIKYVSGNSIEFCRNFTFREKDETYYLCRTIQGEYEIDGELVFDKNGKLLSNTMAKFDDTLSCYYKAPSAEAVGNALALKADVSKVVSIEPQELTDEQKAQARANIDKYIWHTHKSLLRECLYAIDTKYPVDFNLAQNILNATNNGNLNALEDIIDLLSWYINATSFPENDSNSLVSSIVQNYEALKNGGALLSSGNYLSIYVSIASDNYINTHIKIYPISKGQYGTHRIEWKRDIDDFYAQWNYNINTNTTAEDKINRRYADKTLTQVGFYADAKAVGDALALKVDKADIVQPDWSQTDETAKDFIRNKPNEYDALELVAEMGLVSPTAADDGEIFTDENGNIYSL